MSAWKSRWSWVRLVKRAASKWIASARCSVSACEETSIAQARSPPSSMRRKVACSSIASGVVRIDLLLDPADHLLDRPQQPAPDPGRLEDLAHEEGGRRLAVGPGDPDHPQLGRRVAPEARRQRRHRRPRVGDHDLRHLQLQLALDHQRRRPAATAAGRIVAVDLLARARRRRACPARPCGCRRRARRSRYPGVADGRAPAPPARASSSSSLIAAILGRRPAPPSRAIPAARRGTGARRRRSCRRPAPRPSRRRFRPAARRRSPRRGTSGAGPGRSR